MNMKQINFRTKTCAKPKSVSLSQQFTKIQKVLTQYEKKKFHPKIQNFHYMSTQTMSKSGQKRKFLLKKDKASSSSQKVYGPLPLAFHQPQTNKKTQKKSYEFSQITLASSQEKQTYTKMSKLRNIQKRRKLKQAYPKYSQRYLQTINKNFIELLGKHVDYIYSTSRENFQDDQKQFVEFHKERNLMETKTHLNTESGCKKYAQIEIEQFLQENTKLTTSQKRRITQYKKRDEIYKDQLELISSRKKLIKANRKDQCFVLVGANSQSADKLRKQLPKQFDRNQFQEEPINFSSKGWVITQNNESNIMTL